MLAARWPHDWPHGDTVSIRRHGKGWRVEFKGYGVRTSKVLPTKAAAEAWHAMQQLEAANRAAGLLPNKTVADALRRYAEDVSGQKRGGRWEILRLAAIERDFPKTAAKRLPNFSPADASEWRDARLKQVSSASVRRELNLLQHVWTVARKEWRWVDANPWTEISKPADSPPRERRVHWTEVRRICRSCGWVSGTVPQTNMQQVAHAFLIALRTALRAGEVLQAGPWALEGATVRLGRTKTTAVGQTVRVPLTPAGVRLIRLVPSDGWALKSSTLDALFRKVCARLLIHDLHFHDSRAEALTQLARRFDVLTLSRISRHKDLRVLQARYYRETAEEIAVRLARR